MGYPSRPVRIDVEGVTHDLRIDQNRCRGDSLGAVTLCTGTSSQGPVHPTG